MYRNYAIVCTESMPLFICFCFVQICLSRSKMKCNEYVIKL